MRLLFLGDFLYDYDYIARDIEKISQYIIKNNYSVILNLEGPLVKSNNMIKKRGEHLYQNYITIEILKKLQVVGVTLANNHIMDFGEGSLVETIRLLDEAGIKHVGAGVNLENAIEPIRIKYDNNELVIFNYGWDAEEAKYATNKSAGCAPLKKQLIIEHIKKEKKNGSKVVIIMHWGFEFNLYPLPCDVELGRELIDQGVDLIVGHHPHLIQPYELYNGKYIYYSIGNFYFSSIREEFDDVVLRGKDVKLCNYGLGIRYILDNEKNEEIDAIYIKYNRYFNKSCILEEINEEILLDITGWNIKKQAYIDLYKKNRNNHNPTLVGKKIVDKFKLIMLEILYETYNILKRVNLDKKIRRLMNEVTK